jgi:hypothetical protein
MKTEMQKFSATKIQEPEYLKQFIDLRITRE